MTAHADLLVELLCEELPAKAVRELADGLLANLTSRLKKSAIAHGAGRSLYTPRRIAVCIDGVALQQPEQTLEKRGPAVAGSTIDGTPGKALLGFAQSCGVAIDGLQKLETDKGAWWVHRQVKPGALTLDALPSIIEDSLKSLPLGKPMRWADRDDAFLRPVHGLIALLGDAVVPAQVYGMHSGRRTRGHRFHSPGELSIPSPGVYIDALFAVHVIVDPAVRRDRVRNEVILAARSLGGEPRLPDDLIDEVSNLTEWPCAIGCTLPVEFMRLPEAVIVTTIDTHQRFFPVVGDHGRLLPSFVGVANIASKDPDEIRKGYERVVRPRLADAAFFFDQDLKQPLAEHLDALKTVTYQQKLGSVYDKAVRVAALARAIAPAAGIDPDDAAAAAMLAKADLMSRMVGEFPELQGQMGRAYALAQGHSESLAIALDEAYAPRQSASPIASSALGQVLALAERLDTLASIFAVGIKPTGNKDPFALRRAALGLARTLIESGIRIDLPTMLEKAIIGVPAQSLKDYLTKVANQSFDHGLLGKLADRLSAPAVDELYEFILERTRAYYTEAGVTQDVFDAVAARRPHDLVDFDRRLKAVLAFKALPACENLVAANKRIRNILRKSEEAGGTLPLAATPALYQHQAEHSLHASLMQALAIAEPAFARGEYVEGLTQLAQLQSPINAFFDGVMVMAEDPSVRANRQALLKRVAESFLQTADVSLLA